MTRVILGVKVVVLVIWTILAFGAYFAINVLGDLLIRNADIVPMPPEALEFVSWLLLAAQKIGFGLTVTVWLVGAGVIIAVGLLARRAAARRGSLELGRTWGEPPAR